MTGLGPMKLEWWREAEHNCPKCGSYLTYALHSDDEDKCKASNCPSDEEHVLATCSCGWLGWRTPLDALTPEENRSLEEMFSPFYAGEEK